ncbi:MAG: helix-turn-helix transcriptional regulator [Cognatishimia sp.]
METAAILTLAGLCLGIALTGLIAVMVRQGKTREGYSLAVIYIAFLGMVALPLFKQFAEAALINYMPMLLILLLALPPAFYHFILAKTSQEGQVSTNPVSWRDLALPAIGSLVCIGYWILPAAAKETMFIAGDLPSGILPAGLALATFTLILIWLIASFAYLIAALRHLTEYRADVRQFYSDVESRDFRWIDAMMVWLVLIWAVGAGSLADDNLASCSLFIQELFLGLIAVGLLGLNLFAPMVPQDLNKGAEEDETDQKYARSALTEDHAAKLATRLEAAMRDDALYLDPSLSLQKLSRHIGALPNQVSQTLNQEIGVSFFDYVARWRVEASKPLIAAGDTSVLTVALEVGFNSRSTFYKAFKRETEMTPKAYRLAHQTAS